MKWTKDSHLTDEQIEFLKCAGGAVRLTSYITGNTYAFTISLTSRNKGLIVKHLDNEFQHYVGYIPFNGHGMGRDQIVHTQASVYPKDHPIFQAFRWAWANKETDKFASKCLLTNA